jgi:hypothetical protein
MRRQFVAGLVLSVMMAASQGCSSSPPSSVFSPTDATPPPTPAVVVATAVAVSGTGAFTAIGETGQLTAVATFSDGTTRDVTTEAQWRSTDPSIFDVSTAGVVRVVAFGRATVQALYGARSGQLQVFANAPGTFLAFGRVREPGQGGIAGVRVLDPQSGRSILTSSSAEAGSFALPGLTNSRLMFDKDGYESREHEVQPNAAADVALQRIIRLTVGGTVTPADLAPHDMSYLVGADRCEPCRLIRVAVPAAGMLRLSLKWSESRTMLNLWANGRIFQGTYPELTADVPVGTGELVVHVGTLRTSAAPGSANYVPFTLAATQ